MRTRWDIGDEIWLWVSDAGPIAGIVDRITAEGGSENHSYRVRHASRMPTEVNVRAFYESREACIEAHADDAAEMALKADVQEADEVDLEC
jgi:hypothetical protein